MKKPTPVKPIVIDNTVITDKAIEEIFPLEEEMSLEPAPLSEAEVEEAVGGDIPVEDSPANMNDEDEEVAKEDDGI